MYLLACLLVFLAAYVVNMTYMSVFYHRGLAHGAVRLSLRTQRFIARTGAWITGLDAKSWVCMHRLHHAHSDTADDPHSPANVGILGVALAQLRSYERVVGGLALERKRYTELVADLDFPVHWLNQRRLWAVPYVLHGGLALGFALATGMWLLAVCYFVGLMSHPVQGWLVNAFGHAVGGRNFATADNSRNNHLVAWFVMGEGFQNNHHKYPGSAKFSYRRWELDPGFVVCRLLQLCGVLKIRSGRLIPSPASPGRDVAASPVRP